jgi:hypothetical protein
MQPSVSRGAVQALGQWLKQSLSPDIKVQNKWPAAGVPLEERVVTVVAVGNRERGDSYGTVEIASRTNISATQCRIVFQQGEVSQPLQLDVWANSDVGRDDVIAQLDQVLHAGRAQTLNTLNSVQSVVSDPFEDELVLAFDPNGPFAGAYCSFLFDDVAIDDTPDSIQRDEYRATLLGSSKMPYLYLRTVPRLISATFEQQVTEATAFPPTTVLPYDTTTLTANGTSKPTVTHGKSTT